VSSGPAGRVFSERLEAFLAELREGETPNSGTFCGHCLNPLPPGFASCDHCGATLSEVGPLASVPDAVVEMHRRKQRRESLVVNAFAYLGLLLGVGLFIALVAIDFFFLDTALWLLVLSIFVLLAGSRVLAALLGGVLGDELGFRFAERRLAGEWEAYQRQVAGGRQRGAASPPDNEEGAAGKSASAGRHRLRGSTPRRPRP
jgi:hypothetical protein